MELLWQIIIGFTLALILHEVTHLVVIIYYKIPIKAIILTKWSGFGFLVDNDKYIKDNLKLALLHFLPLIWCFVFFINKHIRIVYKVFRAGFYNNKLKWNLCLTPH